jgi:hypothetical protein
MRKLLPIFLVFVLTAIPCGNSIAFPPDTGSPLQALGCDENEIPKMGADGEWACSSDATGVGGDQLVDIVATSPLTVNGGAAVNNALPGADADITFAIGSVLTHELGGLEANVSAYSGLVAITGGSTAEVDSVQELEDQLADAGAYASDQLAFADAAAAQAAYSVDDLITLSGAAEGATHLGDFTGDTITDGSSTIKAALQALETAVEAAGAADAFTVKVDAGATAGYLGAANSDGVLRTDGTVVTYADGGDYVTIGVHAYLADIAGITAAQGDVIYFDGTDWTNLGPGVDGQFLESGGAGANPNWGDPTGSGDITGIGDVDSGLAFQADSAGNTLYFEGTSANAYEIALTGANPGADVTVTIPAETGTIALGPAGYGTDNILVKTNGTGNLTQATGIAVDDSNNMSNIGTIGSGAITSTGNITSGDSFIIGSADIEEAELEILDGATLGTADINIIDGISDSGTLTAAELLHVDGVTSAIQDQIDGKQAADATLTDIADGTIAENLVNTDNPWANNEVAADLTIDGGTVDNSIIGGSTPAAGTFTTLEAGAGGFTVDPDGDTVVKTLATAAATNPYWHFNQSTADDFWIGSYDTTVDRLELRKNVSVNTSVLSYWDANHQHLDGNMNLTTGHTYQINDTQIALTNLSDGLSHASGHIQGGADEIDGDLIDIDYAETGWYTPATTGVAYGCQSSFSTS